MPEATPFTPVTVGNVHGKTLKTVTGTISSSGETIVIAANPYHIHKVIAYGLFTTSTTLINVTIKKDSSGVVVWTVPLQAITGGVFGANLATEASSFIFASGVGCPLVFNLDQSQTITFNLTYFDDAFGSSSSSSCSSSSSSCRSSSSSSSSRSSSSSSRSSSSSSSSCRSSSSSSLSSSSSCSSSSSAV